MKKSDVDFFSSTKILSMKYVSTVSFVTKIDFQLMVWVRLYPFHWFKQSFLARHIQVSAFTGWIMLVQPVDGSKMG